MSNHHFEKWLYKTALGFLLVAGGVFFMYYSLSHFVRANWVLHSIICTSAISVGVFLLSSGAINKVKSDMIKKQKIRQQSL